MDPNATFDLYCAALLAGDVVARRAAAFDLMRWLDRGGFEPRWDRHAQVYHDHFTREAEGLRERAANG